MIKSLMNLWIADPQLVLSVRHALLKSLITSVVIFAALAFFTFLPQMAILAVFTGPLSPIIALVLVYLLLSLTRLEAVGIVVVR